MGTDVLILEALTRQRKINPLILFLNSTTYWSKEE